MWADVDLNNPNSVPFEFWGNRQRFTVSPTSNTNGRIDVDAPESGRYFFVIEVTAKNCQQCCQDQCNNEPFEGKPEFKKQTPSTDYTDTKPVEVVLSQRGCDCC